MEFQCCQVSNWSALNYVQSKVKRILSRNDSYVNVYTRTIDFPQWACLIKLMTVYRFTMRTSLSGFVCQSLKLFSLQFPGYMIHKICSKQGKFYLYWHVCHTWHMIETWAAIQTCMWHHKRTICKLFKCHHKSHRRNLAHARINHHMGQVLWTRTSSSIIHVYKCIILYVSIVWFILVLSIG